MNDQCATDILKKYSQRTTYKRVALLELLMKSPKSYSLSDIEKKISIDIDRVTIYRTLNMFESIGLVTKVVDHKGTCQYMYNCDKHDDKSTHPHLQCKCCGNIVCLPCLPNEYLEKLENYEIEQMYFLLEGTCPDCSSQKM
jgi:Fur family ferric uptake transcriptional regulator